MSSCQYGAPLGVADFGSYQGQPVTIRRVSIDVEGYSDDRFGYTYWGLGEPLYCVKGEDFLRFRRESDLFPLLEKEGVNCPLPERFLPLSEYVSNDLLDEIAEIVLADGLYHCVESEEDVEQFPWLEEVSLQGGLLVTAKDWLSPLPSWHDEVRRIAAFTGVEVVNSIKKAWGENFQLLIEEDLLLKEAMCVMEISGDGAWYELDSETRESIGVKPSPKAVYVEPTEEVYKLLTER